MNLPYDTNELLKRSQAMLDQNKSQGFGTAFAGSSFDTGALQPQQPIQPVQPIQQVPQPSTNVSVTPPKAVSPDSVGTNTNVSALQEALSQNQKLQQQYLDYVNAPKPQEELTLESQLDQLRQNAMNTETGIREGLNLTEDQTIPMEFITGQQASIERRGNAKMLTYAAQEKALAERLGVKQQERQGKFAALKDAIGMSQGNVDNALKLQEAVQSQQDQVLKMMAYQSDEAKNSLATILTRFPGMDYESLDPQTQSQLAQLATANGIPFQALVAGMKSTKDEADFMMLMKQKELQQNSAYKDAQINSLNYKIGSQPSMALGSSVMNTPSGAKYSNNQEYGTPEYMINLIRSTKGGKDVDASSIQAFQKSRNVLGQLVDLQANINDTVTGPIAGIVRSNNPYDTKAQLIKAQLTAIIPNLARGVYGEVGVLTDNDVKLYSQTIPNLTSTDAIKRAILASTVRSIQRSLEGQIETQAGFGRDVSGLENIYNDLVKKANDLEASITQIDDTSKFESMYKQDTGSGWSDGVFGKIGKFFFGDN